MQKYPTFATVVAARKNPILKIAESKIDKIFTAQRYKLNAHFDSIFD